MSRWPYSTQRWQRLRRQKLREHPLCQVCLEQGAIVPAAVVDHVLAIKAGGAPYPALDQLRSMCESCHNRKTRHVEQLGKAEAPKVWGCDEFGYPRDPAHPWNARRP
ncbi:MAG: HNH endonuclease signature motif containing protein [Pseudolabrys sp.]